MRHNLVIKNRLKHCTYSESNLTNHSADHEHVSNDCKIVDNKDVEPKCVTQANCESANHTSENNQTNRNEVTNISNDIEVRV